MNFHQQCREVSNVSDGVITNALMGNFNYDPQLASHLRCMAEKMNLQDSNGRINRDVLRNMLSMVITDPARLHALVNQCAVEQSTPDQTAFKASQCLYTSVRSGLMG